MKTTIELPDSLLKKAKIRAIEKGLSFKDFVIQALETSIADQESRLSEIEHLIQEMQESYHVSNDILETQAISESLDELSEQA